MSRIMDYIYWRGDLSFKQEPFNAIDAAIFSQFSLLDFDDIVPPDGEGIPLWRLFELYIEKGYKVSDPVGLLISNKQHYLFQAAAKAPRYKDLLCPVCKEHTLFSYEKGAEQYLNSSGYYKEVGLECGKCGKKICITSVDVGKYYYTP